METFSLVNKEVNVNSFYFTNNQNFKSFPRRIEYEGQAVSFVESGLRLLVQSGQRLAELFDMSDGNRTYRLRHEGADWTLVGIKGGNL